MAILVAFVGMVPGSAEATTVKRNISKDTTWSQRKGPYVIAENIVVEHGATLKIEPGTRVELEPDIKIEIRGTFLAAGTPDDPIIFTGHSDEPWDTLYFTDFSTDAVYRDDAYAGGCILEQCVIEKGRGIFVRFGAPLITDCTIRDNYSSGIRVEFGAPRIVRNRIFNNSTAYDPASGNGGGIIAYTDKSMLIADNIIRDNISDGGRDGGGGIYAYASDQAHIILRNNTVFGNSSSRLGGGIYAYNSVLAGNTIVNNRAALRGGGIYAVESSLVENLVQANTASVGGGIFAENSEVVSNSILRNVALRPEGGALHYFGSGNVRDNNMLFNNTGDGAQGCGGVYVSGNPTIKENNIFNNSGYALHVANVADAPEVSAAGNFWGVRTERAVLDLMYDWLDDENTGLANVTPYLREPATHTPAIPPSNLVARGVEEGVHLSWEEPKDTRFQGHILHIGATSGYPYERAIRTGPDTNFIVKGLKPGNEYWLAVSGYRTADGVETESGLSGEIRIQIADSTASVDTPNIVSTALRMSEKGERWELRASSPSSESRVATSRWQISPSADDFTALVVDTFKSGSALDLLEIPENKFDDGQDYFCRVAYATSRGDWSAWSTPVSFTTAPRKPSRLAGPISTTVRLERKFSPYHMVSNTLVSPNGELRIEPGVTIKVAPGKSLMVRGKLVARGTTSGPITFTREESGKWGRIIFSDASGDAILNENRDYIDGCVLEQCVVEHGGGILIKSASPLIKSCTISYHDGSGITVRQGGPVISDNDIHHNTAPTNGGGIYAYTNDVVHVKANTIHDNQADGDGGGVFAYGYMNTSTIRVEGNTIYSNAATGDGGGIYLSRSSAINNTIESNRVGGNGGGIYATFGLVTGNRLHGNQAAKGGGVFAEQNSSITRNQVVANRAESGLGGGVYINFWGTSIENESFMENTVTDNTAPTADGNGGVFIVGYLFFENNNIYGNTGSELYNGNEAQSYPLKVTQCYWGTDDKDKISKQIVDGNDKPELGEVTFEPYSEKPFVFD
jgi:hypothetical protein